MSGIEYRTVPGYSAYRVGSDGSIWTSFARGGDHKKVPWRKMKVSPNSDGYRQVRIISDLGIYHSVKVARLVCSAFHGPCPIGQQVRHLDCDQLNDVSANLSWGTSKQNTEDSIILGKRHKGESHHHAKLKDSEVAIIYSLRGAESAAVLALRFGVSKSLIGNIWNGHRINPNYRKERKR